MELSERGAIHQTRSDGLSNIWVVDITDSVAQLEAKVRAYEEILKLSTIPSENVREHLIKAGYVIQDTIGGQDG